MAYTKIIPQARLFTMTTNTVYALPSRRCLIRHQGGGTLELSNDGTTFIAPTLISAQIETSARFARSTTDISLVSLTVVG